MLVMRGRARYPSRGLFVGAEDLVPGLGPFETCQGTLDRKCWSCLGLIVAADYGHIVGQQRLGIRMNWTLFRTSMLFRRTGANLHSWTFQCRVRWHRIGMGDAYFWYYSAAWIPHWDRCRENSAPQAKGKLGTPHFSFNVRRPSRVTQLTAEDYSLKMAKQLRLPRATKIGMLITLLPLASFAGKCSELPGNAGCGFF
jgi:hypothetical protein